MRSSPNHGEGSVFQEGVNKWTAKIILGRSPDGKPLIKKFSAKTRKEVERKLRDFKKMQASQAAPSPVHFTVRDYFEYWLKTYQFQKLKPLSYDCLEGSVQNHIYPRLGKMNFGSVSRDDIQQLINDLYHKQHLSYSSRISVLFVASLSDEQTDECGRRYDGMWAELTDNL